MCGIVGYVGKDKAIASVIEGLKSLEYRGYDSAGIAYMKDGVPTVVRTPGRVADLEEKLGGNLASGTAIGHTRWATHGVPSEENAHPHRDPSGKFVIVHNGIIDNFQRLRQDLEEEGNVFKSSTDSEVVAHLIARAYKGNLVEAVEKIMPMLDGTFALGVMAADNPELIVGARRGSPLAVGVGEGVNLLASDAVPILPHTKMVVFLDDEQVAVLTPGSVRVRQGGKDIECKPEEIKWSAEAAQKGGYPHFMLKEIYEQPAVLENMVRTRIKLSDKPDAEPRFNLNGIDLPDDYFKGISRIILVAQGTAYHACMVGRNMIERVARIPAYPEYAADFRYRDPILDPSVLVIAVTQSGETMDTLHAVRLARQNGCKVISVVSAVGSTIARESDGVFYLHCGPEIGVASTKAFTSMIAGLYIIALRMGQIRETLSVDECRRRTEDLMGAGARVEGILSTANYVRNIALKYKDSQNFLFLGRGTGWPIAMEGALKLKEVSYIHAEGYDAAEMKHGTHALND
ncbi:MAG: glutamine--fructose-6-phosphate transaminase (isomerizing), partial [Planctomycetes bacterium]|nr:glutamine--fructose-6-phosphate transaminase (isomerizing) [Planctomycetota bacterium]